MARGLAALSPRSPVKTAPPLPIPLLGRPAPAMSPDQELALFSLIDSGCSVLVSGPVASGKTVLLDALLAVPASGALWVCEREPTLRSVPAEAVRVCESMLGTPSDGMPTLVDQACAALPSRLIIDDLYGLGAVALMTAHRPGIQIIAACPSDLTDALAWFSGTQIFGAAVAIAHRRVLSVNRLRVCGDGLAADRIA